MNPAVETIPNVATTLIDALIAGNRGDRQAFVYNAKRYSYQDVAALMNRAGSMLKALGVEAGARVLLLLPPSPALVASLLGAMKAGAVAVVGVPRDAATLGRCVATIRPAAAIVHESHLPDAGRALAGLPRENVIVVGSDAHGHRSFVDEMRTQPSWLAAQDVGPAAPALAVWTGSAITEVTHAELAAFVQGSGDLPAMAADSPVTGLGAMLRALSRGEEIALV